MPNKIVTYCIGEKGKRRDFDHSPASMIHKVANPDSSSVIRKPFKMKATLPSTLSCLGGSGIISIP
jgi:hypothetical protein